MSISIGFRPHNPKKLTWINEAHSGTYKALENNFGKFPLVLTEYNISALTTISACGYEEVDELISAIYKFGSIYVEAQ